MPGLTAKDMSTIDRQRQERQDKLEALTVIKHSRGRTKIPFDVTNLAHIVALNNYLDHFEWTVHRMFIFQG